MAVKAGATIELLTGEMKVNDEMTKVAAHLRPELQFFGFSGSSSNVSRMSSVGDVGWLTRPIPRDEIWVLLS